MTTSAFVFLWKNNRAAAFHFTIMSHKPDEGFQWLDVELSDVLFVLRRHLWLLIAAPATGFALALLISFLVRPQFTTEALIYLRPNFDKDMQVEQVYSKLEDDDSLRSIERSMISDTVILRMVDRLELREEEDFLGRGALDEGPLSDAKLLKLIRDRYQTELVPTTRLVELRVDDYSAQRATVVANTLIDEFLVHLRDDRSCKETELRTALTAQVEKSLAATLALESELQAFRSGHPDQFVEQDSEIFHERILQQGTALNEANAEMARLAGTVQALGAIDPQTDPYRVFQILSNRNSEYLSNLLSMLAAAKTELAGVKKRSTEIAPDYRAAVSRLEEVESTMRDYAIEMKNGAESEYRAAVEKVAKLGESLAGLQGEFVNFKSTSAEFRGVKGEIDRNWNTFSKLQQSIMDLDVEPETTPTFVTVVSEPVVPDKKSKPFRVLWVAAGTMLGGMFAAGVLAIRHRRGLPFTSPEQAAQRFETVSVATLKVPERGSTADVIAQLEKSPKLLNVLIALRDSNLVHVAAAEPESASVVIPEVIGRLCAGRGIETLWIVLESASEGPQQTQSTAVGRLSKFTVSADQLLDTEQFGKGLTMLCEKFDKVIVDTTRLEESEARAAVARMVPRTLLLIDGTRVPRPEYNNLVSQFRSVETCDLSLIYFTLEGKAPKGAAGRAEHHQVATPAAKAGEPRVAAST